MDTKCLTTQIFHTHKAQIGMLRHKDLLSRRLSKWVAKSQTWTYTNPKLSNGYSNPKLHLSTTSFHASLTQLKITELSLDLHTQIPNYQIIGTYANYVKLYLSLIHMMIQIVGTQILNATTNHQKSRLDLHTKITSCSRIFKYQAPPDAALVWCFLALFSMIMTRSKTKAQSAPAFTVTVYVGLPNHLHLTATCRKPPKIQWWWCFRSRTKNYVCMFKKNSQIPELCEVNQEKLVHN
jgi:hypothetical protein